MHISRFKYPRTFHLPYSETLSDDDKRLPDDNPNGCSIAKYVRKNHVTTDSHWAEHWTRNETC